MSAAVNPVRGSGHPIARAYLLADMGARCDSCGAGPAQHCRRHDGQVRRTPCLNRLRLQPTGHDAECPPDAGIVTWQPL